MLRQKKTTAVWAIRHHHPFSISEFGQFAEIIRAVRRLAFEYFFRAEVVFLFRLDAIKTDLFPGLVRWFLLPTADRYARNTHRQ